ncbi:hypothetical protein E1A91_A01G077900v1 [Gossypium mustelinum]|uniref:Uncharacterized protein n=1 Tax=Gossypium mustelinum TaxID=34275 RepID=A0A5D3AFM0_GOSMU|nr:hypothetical protein E1A91_A01G077900v1 [Gossypium mustelinum]
MKLTEIREAKFMDMLDAREKKYEALINECMAKGMSIEFKVADLMIKPSVRMMMNEACCILCITYICYSG